LHFVKHASSPWARLDNSQKPSPRRATLFRYNKCLTFFTLRDQLVVRQKPVSRVEDQRELLRKVEQRVYFEQQILALLLVFHQTSHATNLLMVRGKLRVIVSRTSPPSVVTVA